ncbi:hypothetical protein RUM44_004334 [Polyplax serrata]|uniref:Phospholipase B1, membrane-associated n=1 Tax=Polyplax serrata TaxID=468196 RepID=A0ABR1B2J9_POLSC
MTFQAQMESFRLRSMYKSFRDFLFKQIERTGMSRGLATADGERKLQRHVATAFSFPCNVTNTRSPTRPTSVHRLRPGDIDVVGAIGDSLTAANGAAATLILQVLNENRGLSALIGGQGNWREFLTLPNILKEFNPNLIGYSLGDALGHHKASQFNAAEPAAMSQDIYFMAKELVRRIKSDKRVDFKNDWKLITLFIGSNDFCLNFCYMNAKNFKNSAETHRRELTAALDYLRDNLPRTLVNVLLPPNLKLLAELKGLPAQCDTLHLVTCPCLFGKLRKSHFEENIRMQTEWQKVQTEVTSDVRYRQKEDFAVVLQTFTKHLTFPEVRQGVNDKSFLSADCFHLSQKGYARVTNALWNNMLEPVGSKSEDWKETFERFLCPTEKHPFIYTYGNSFRS